jgi:DNA invertase Pin-like site-specific DNA recombinase
MTDAKILIPAAQYVRMSTEHQQYSLDNQKAAIQRYAERRGFEIVYTYSDAARSGLVLRHRAGLRQLLHDVTSQSAKYKAILVYDVSRWGRFQDCDEAAHYEFLCKLGGTPIHYCAETFDNDGSLPSLIMKALKRTMAGEYSRELSVKVLAGQKRLAGLGFKQGGAPGYGLRRMMVSSDRLPKQRLNKGETKGLATDRVILVPGPAQELEVVREIYKMLISDGLSVHAIAKELNRKGVEPAYRAAWSYASVYGVLTQLKYIGCHAFGRTSQKLSTPPVRLATSEWVVTPRAFEPIVRFGTFLQAQHILYKRSLNKPNEELLSGLRGLLARRGRLSGALIAASHDMPSPSTYVARFGSLKRAYELIGYGRPEHFGPLELRRRTQILREELMNRLAEMFPQELELVRRTGKWRSKLILPTGQAVSILIVRSIKYSSGTVRWKVEPVQRERECVTLLARLDKENGAFLDFHVLPGARKAYLRFDDPSLGRGLPLHDLSEFCAVVANVAGHMRTTKEAS